MKDLLKDITRKDSFFEIPLLIESKLMKISISFFIKQKRLQD